VESIHLTATLEQDVSRMFGHQKIIEKKRGYLQVSVMSVHLNTSVAIVRAANEKRSHIDLVSQSSFVIVCAT